MVVARAEADERGPKESDEPRARRPVPRRAGEKPRESDQEEDKVRCDVEEIRNAEEYALVGIVAKSRVLGDGVSRKEREERRDEDQQQHGLAPVAGGAGAHGVIFLFAPRKTT